MTNFEDKLNSDFYKDKPKSLFIEDLEKETQKLREENKKWSVEFNKVAEIFKTAKSLEKTDIYKSIGLYESIKNTNYGKFDSVGRLILLYRKTKQKEKERQHLEFKLEEAQNSEYNRMRFLQEKYPEESENIKYHYENKIEYLSPELLKINFHSKIEKLTKELELIYGKP